MGPRPVEPDPRHDGATDVRAGGIDGSADGLDELLLGVDLGDGHVEDLPAHDVDHAELLRHTAGVVDLHEVAASSVGLPRITALRVAAVDDGRPLLREHAMGVDVARAQ